MKINELKLGAFVVGALTVLIIGIFSIKDFKVFNPGYIIKVQFGYGNGIKPAAPVRVSGIEAGEIKKTKIVSEHSKTKIEVYAWIKNEIKIPVGSKAFVNSLGLLGEKYLEIIPAEDSSEYLKEDDVIVGNDSVPMFKISEFVQMVLNKLNQVLGSIEDIVGDKKTAEDFKESIGNLAKTSTELNEFIDSLKNKKGTVGKLIYEDSLHRQLEEFIADLKKHPWKLLYVPKEEIR